MLIPRSDHQTRDGVELKTTMKILAFSSAPLLVGAMLGFLPLGLSSVIGAIYAFVLIVFGLSIRFRVSLARAFGVVVLPGILGVTVLGCIIGVFAGLFFGLIASIFSGFH